jgi:hypothetical protein
MVLRFVPMEPESLGMGEIPSVRSRRPHSARRHLADGMSGFKQNRCSAIEAEQRFLFGLSRGQLSTGSRSNAQRTSNSEC